MFLHCSAGGLCNFGAVYAVCAQYMQCHAAMAIRRLGSRPIIPGARWCAGVVSLSVSGCAPSPPLPGGWRKNGAALRRQPMRYDTQPFETSRQTSSRSTQVQRTECVFNVLSVRSPQDVLDRACLSVRFSRLSERARRYPMQDLVEARRKPARYFMYHLGRAFSFHNV